MHTTTRSTLFAIGDDLRALADLMAECDTELTREADEALGEWFMELSQDEGNKLDSYYGLIRELESEESAAKAEADRWTAKAKNRGGNARRLKDRVKGYIDASDRKQVTTAKGRVFAIQANGGVQAVRLADNLDPTTIPDEFVQVKRLPDNEAIRKHLAAGGVLPFAELLPRSSSLRIR